MLFSALLGFFSCSKDQLNPDLTGAGTSTDHQPVADREAGDISIAAARQWFSNAYGLKKSITNQNTLPNTMLDVVPVWAFAQTATYLSATPIVICPVQPPGQAHTLSRFFLMFYRPSSGQITARLIIFRGVDAYATNGKAFALADFTGALASLDMSGNYAGTMHLLSNGLQVSELDPTVAGNGLLYDGGTVVASQKPWWAVSGGGSWYFDGTNIWINSDPLPGPFINQTFTPLAPTPTQGGGGTVTGPPNTNPLDAHFQNLLSNPLYILEEYLFDNNMDGGVFDYLDNAAKAVLANRLYFIDLLYDFLQEHENTSPAQDLVSEILTQVALYNLTSLTMDDLNSLFISLPLLDEVIVGPTGQGGPGISAANPMCGQMFDFRYNHTQTKQAAGIRNLKVTLPLNGVNTDFTFNTIYFESNNMGGVCPESFNQKAADAINAATSATIQRIGNNTLYGDSTDELSDRIRNTFFCVLFLTFSQEVNQCGPADGRIPTTVKLLSGSQWIDYNQASNTLFRDFSTDFTSFCN